MKYTYIIKQPFSILAFGLAISSAMPGTSDLSSPRFLCIYISAVISGVSGTCMALRHGSRMDVILATLASILFTGMLPFIKIYFS